MFKIHLLFVLIGITFFSCVNHKNTLLLKYEAANSGKVYSQNLIDVEYLIQEGDLIDIHITNPDYEAVRIFEKKMDGVDNKLLTSYQVDRAGDITLPLVGRVKASGLTLEELKTALEKELKQFFKFVFVDVKLLTYKITVIGEVHKQGTYNIISEKATFFEVISMAGGLTEYSNTINVRILRSNKGETKVDIVNVSNVEFITSEFYSLQPNDIIYIEPVKAKSVKSNIQLYLLIASVSSVIASMISIIINNK